MFNSSYMLGGYIKDSRSVIKYGHTALLTGEYYYYKINININPTVSRPIDPVPVCVWTSETTPPWVD